MINDLASSLLKSGRHEHQITLGTKYTSTEYTSTKDTE